CIGSSMTEPAAGSPLSLAAPRSAPESRETPTPSRLELVQRDAQEAGDLELGPAHAPDHVQAVELLGRARNDEPLARRLAERVEPLRQLHLRPDPAGDAALSQR